MSFSFKLRPCSSFFLGLRSEFRLLFVRNSLFLVSYSLDFVTQHFRGNLLQCSTSDFAFALHVLFLSIALSSVLILTVYTSHSFDLTCLYVRSCLVQFFGRSIDTSYHIFSLLPFSSYS